MKRVSSLPSAASPPALRLGTLPNSRISPRFSGVLEQAFVNISEAAALLGVSRVSVSRWIHAGQLPVARLGHRTVRIRRDDVQRLLERRGLTGMRPWAGRRRRSDDDRSLGPASQEAVVNDKAADIQGTRPAWGDLRSSGHLVQFYEHDAFLMDEVATFIGEALLNGGAGVVIATPEHRAGLTLRFATRGIDVAKVGERASLWMLDAAESLASFLIDGEPDAGRFFATLGSVLASAGREGKPVRAFGEMVVLLLEAGNPTAAMQLERLWNDLGQHHSFALLCAYPLDLFGDGRLAGFWHDVCAAHTSVIPAESYTAVVSQDAKQRSVATLQYKAQLLEAEMAARRQTEAHLRRLLAERDQLLPEGERLLAREHAARTSAAVALPTQRDTAGGVP